MPWISKLFDRFDADSDERVRYNPRLIKNLMRQHRHIVHLIEKVSKAAENSDFNLTKQRLRRFLRALNTHVVIENHQFYVYLSRYVNDDSHNELATSMKLDMIRLEKQVKQFVNRYLDKGISNDNIDAFKRDLDAITKILLERIDCEEESLYTLYLPPID